VRIELVEAPGPVVTVGHGEELELRYRARNVTPAATTGHWDRVAVFHGADAVHEDWRQPGRLDPGATYESSFVVRPLPADVYTVELAVDAGTRGHRRAACRLVVEAPLPQVSVATTPSSDSTDS
jgi:hypothetical protein